MNESLDMIAARQIASKAMMTKSILPLCVVLASSVYALGCIAAEGDGDTNTESVTSDQQPTITVNAITSNAITSNAITSNAITSNAITSNAITSNALTDPNARMLFKYIVSCALPASAHVDLTIDSVDYSFPGEIGLTPKWGLPGGSCNETCQRWVSACVLARVDYLGAKVDISLRGPHANLTASPAERAAFTVREGVYYGNIFRAPADQERYACVAPGRKGLPRVCGPTLDGCVVEATGWCNDTCGGTLPDGAYLDCHDSMRVNNQFPASSENFPTSVTVFLKP